MSFGIRDVRFGLEVTNTALPAPPQEVWAHTRTNGDGTYGGTTNAGNVWIWTTESGFRRLNIWPAYGAWALAFGYDGNVYWQEQTAGVRREPIAGGADEYLPSIQPSAVGLLDVTPANVVIPDFGQGVTVTLADGSSYTIPKGIERNGVVAGYANEAPVGVVAFVRATKTLYDVWAGDPLSLPVRLDDTGQLVAVSGDLANGFIPMSQWTVLVPQVLPTYAPTPLTRPAYFCAFLASGVGNPPSWANAWIFKNSNTRMYTRDGQAWNVRLLEAGTGSTQSPCVYVGSPDAFRVRFPVTVDDIVAPWIYREPTISDAVFTAYAQQVISNVRWMFPECRLMPIWNDTTRIGASGPTLTKDEVLSGLVIGSSFGLDAGIFESGRAGEVLPEAPQLLTQWRNGQPCPVQVLPPPVQHSASGARRRR